jgi:glycosyltransferase involved in cell wall biosynthesis
VRTAVIELCRDVAKRTICPPKFAANRWLLRRTAARGLERKDERPIPCGAKEIRAFMVVRNEALRLPFTLEYYFSRGVDRIFLIDNDSTDETASIALAHQNTHVFFTRDTYSHQANWVDILLRRYGTGHWCLVVDADELLIYPHCEKLPLKDLCRFLDRESCNAVDCVLLDMYPDKSLELIDYRSGTDPLRVARWFDNSGYTTDLEGPVFINEQNVAYRGPGRLFGGMRQRVFGVNACLSKLPLVKFNKGMFLSPGAHFVQGARISKVRGALLHFKFLQDFAQNVKREATREQHWQKAAEQKQYWSKVRRFPNLNFHSSTSEEFASSEQLVRLGMMKSPTELDVTVENAPELVSRID